MDLLRLIENSALIEWFLTSIWGFPVFIALHSVGMAFVVGLSLIIALRYLGFIEEVTFDIVGKLFKFAWFGFLLNLVTGIFLLLSRISQYLFDLTFLIKIGLVVLAAVGLRLMQLDFQASMKKAPALTRRLLPVLTVLFWFSAVTAGRWIAYLSGIYS